MKKKLSTIFVYSAIFVLVLLYINMSVKATKVIDAYKEEQAVNEARLEMMYDLISDMDDYTSGLLANMNKQAADTRDIVSYLQADIDFLEEEISLVNGRIDSLMEEVLFENKDIADKIEALASDVDDIETKISKVQSKINEFESRIVPMTAEYNVLKIDPGISASKANKVTVYYNMLPESLRDSLVNNGFTIYLTTQNLDILFDRPNTAAMFSPSQSTIFLSSRSDDGLLHEVGHYIDYLYDWNLSSNMPDDVYNIELSGLLKLNKNVIKDNYDTKIEYFAECFTIYVLNPNGLKQYCPQTYYLIESHIP